MAFRDYYSELIGTIPHLPPPLARTLINRAWKDIRDLRLWSWLIGYGDIVAPAQITAGTVTTTLGSTVVQLDAAAAAALQPVALANPPVSSSLLGQGRQIRMGVQSSSGPLYTIVAADFTANTLTLDRAYAAVGGAGQTYQCYKAYYAPPDTDFLRYLTITNMTSGYSITGRKLYYDQTKLNLIDPQRGAKGDAYLLAAFSVDSTGRPVTEWYPHPTNLAVYNCIYRRRGVDLSETVDLPATFPSTALIHRAMMHAAQWATANVATFPELGQTNWMMFIQARQSMFKETIIQAIKQDDEIFPRLPTVQGSGFDFPLGGEFLQSHDITSLVGGF